MRNKKKFGFIKLSLILIITFSANSLFSYEIFIFRPYLKKQPFFPENKLTLHGEFFFQLQAPTTFPSYNDLSGKEDRWNFGFQNLIFLTDSTSFLAQLVAHDDGGQRTKFDWHFSFRQNIFDHLVLIIGHDSNHDSDHQSTGPQTPYFVNRNYIGFGIPIRNGLFYVEPYLLFFLHNTTQMTFLDQSGNRLQQEAGLRVGLWIKKWLGFNLQVISRSDQTFSIDQDLLLDIIIRVRILKNLEFALGTSLWADIKESPLGNKQNFHKFIWGLAVPF